MMGELIATLFLSREIAHRAHLKTESFAQHEALGAFYDQVVEDADAIAEAYQGRNGVIKDIPFLPADDAGNIADILERHMDSIEGMRYKAAEKSDTPIQNLIDTALENYLSTLFKLRRLK